MNWHFRAVDATNSGVGARSEWVFMAWWWLSMFGNGKLFTYFWKRTFTKNRSSII
jgi:hypothetical protein